MLNDFKYKKILLCLELIFSIVFITIGWYLFPAVILILVLGIVLIIRFFNDLIEIIKTKRKY